MRRRRRHRSNLLSKLSRLGGDDYWEPISFVSSMIVTGPSFMSCTSICSANTPVSTARPFDLKQVQKCSYSRLASAGGAASTNDGLDNLQ
jgi:hypothetical protein